MAVGVVLLSAVAGGGDLRAVPQHRVRHDAAVRRRMGRMSWAGDGCARRVRVA